MGFSVEELWKMMVDKESSSLWIFGYASLIWRPGFNYKLRTVGHIRGYARKFFQGTTTHRGTPEWPGRVATLLPEPEVGVVWGVAYKIMDPQEITFALKYLAERELLSGGYHFDKVNFQPLDESIPSFPIVVYVAEPGNNQYLGDVSIELQAYQIAKAKGVCGPNYEYINKVVEFHLKELGIKKLSDLREKDPYLHNLHVMVMDFVEKRVQPSYFVLQDAPMLVRDARVDVEFTRKKRSESAGS